MIVMILSLSKLPLLQKKGKKPGLGKSEKSVLREQKILLIRGLLVHFPWIKQA